MLSKENRPKDDAPQSKHPYPHHNSSLGHGAAIRRLIPPPLPRPHLHSVEPQPPSPHADAAAATAARLCVEFPCHCHAPREPAAAPPEMRDPQTSLLLGRPRPRSAQSR